MHDLATVVANVPKLENIATTDNAIQVAITSLTRLVDRRSTIVDLDRTKQVHEHSFEHFPDP